MKILMVEGQGDEHSELLECLREKHFEVNVCSLKLSQVQKMIKEQDTDYNYVIIDSKSLVQESGEKEICRCGDLQMNLTDQIVTRDGREISLTDREFQLLEYLMKNQNKFLSREQIMKQIWQLEDTNTNVVDVYIYYLRTKIDADFEKKLLRTMRGVGYCLSESDGE